MNITEYKFDILKNPVKEIENKTEGKQKENYFDLDYVKVIDVSSHSI